MRGAEVQSGANTLRFELFHQRITADAAALFVNANNKQMPGVQMRPARHGQRLKRRIRQFAHVAQGYLTATLIALAQFAQLYQRQRGVNIGEVIFESRANHLRLRRTAVGLAIVGIDAQTVELEATNAVGQLFIVGASNYLEYYSRGENEIVATIRIAKEWEDKFYCGVRLYKVSSTLTGGAFYKDPSGNFGEELWLCPVTLFLLGKYPKLIFIYKINKNYLHCPICIE